MKAIVCVKQVPDTSGVVAVKEDGTMDRAAMATITNHDDLAAVAAALQLKDETGCEVIRPRIWRFRHLCNLTDSGCCGSQDWRG